MRVKMSKQPPPAPTASAVGPCPTVIQIVGRPGTGSLPSTIAPPDHHLSLKITEETEGRDADLVRRPFEGDTSGVVPQRYMLKSDRLDFFY